MYVIGKKDVSIDCVDYKGVMIDGLLGFFFIEKNLMRIICFNEYFKNIIELDIYYSYFVVYDEKNIWNFKYLKSLIL